MAKLGTLEATRGMAAAAVVLDHADAAVRNGLGASAHLELLEYGKYGVDYFFVLSGFVIVWAHYEDIGRRATCNYALKRFIRLYPVAWMVVGTWLLIRFFWAGRIEPIEKIVTSLFFFPSLIDPIPTAVWTLRHELLFYLMFSMLLLSRRAGAFLLAAWILGCLTHTILALTGRPFTGILAFLFSTYHFDFLIGGVLALIHKRRQFRASKVPISFALLLLFIIFYFTWAFSIHRMWLNDYESFAATAWTLIFGLTFGLLLHGVVVLEGIWNPSRFYLALGASSYFLYLIHDPLISVGQRIVFIAPGVLNMPGLASSIFLVVCVTTSLAGHFYIEAPMNSHLRAILLPAKVEELT
jgi:exopolysaccharide production protein ExoZ